MCLTNTVNFIDFEHIDEQKRMQLDELKHKMQARRDALQVRIDELDAGLRVLEENLGK